MVNEISSSCTSSEGSWFLRSTSSLCLDSVLVKQPSKTTASHLSDLTIIREYADRSIENILSVWQLHFLVQVNIYVYKFLNLRELLDHGEIININDALRQYDSHKPCNFLNLVRTQYQLVWSSFPYETGIGRMGSINKWM